MNEYIGGVKNRRKRALQRLEKQLEPEKAFHLSLINKTRIEKEIETLKKRI